mgnify:CR=1 FL=1
MVNLITLSVGIGLIVNLVFAEFLGLAAGGMVVPGYLALFANHPERIIATFALAIITYALISGISRFTILFGKRKIALTLLISFCLGYILQSYAFKSTLNVDSTLQAIGFTIPGLIALWFSRQGIVQTLSVLTIGLLIIRLSMVIFLGQEFSI